MVDANTTVTRSLARLFREPVMFIMFYRRKEQRNNAQTVTGSYRCSFPFPRGSLDG